MREIFLGRTKDPMAPAHFHGIVEALEQAAAQRVKVYRTYVIREDGFGYVFTTTSKDVHLGLGALSEEGRQHLAFLLHEEFIGRKDEALLLFTHPQGNRDGLLVTLQTTAGPSMHFHVSSAR